MAVSTTVRLTQQVKAGGCASKLAPGTLAAVLARLPKPTDPNLLVGYDTADDAGIFQIAANLALVQTVDFFTPLVDDPFTFGQIAATNALSDVYAMGGRPITALSVVCFPQDGDLDVLEQIMKGGMAKMAEAGCAVVGGHSVRDSEIKFGYAVTGLIDPERVFTNAAAVVGDAVILTKPIGTGVITTALKQGVAEPECVASAVRSMTTLNREAAELVGRAKGVHAMTDVTGFGLMGHCREMALGSGVTIEIVVEAVPVIEGAVDAVRAGAVPAGLLANRSFAECISGDAPGSQIPDDLRTLLYDPQTAGGLLISVSADFGDALLGSLRNAGLCAARIGSVVGTYVPGAGAPAILLR
ncbi:MAG TPA: selenide, water dikinase SelD [Silvibacterium sp.]|nr:selenide, water dikinase SelD [Silvibacterium sp.]